LKEALEESNLPFRVDLLVWDKLPENFQRNIEEGYMVLIEADVVERSRTNFPEHWQLLPLEEVMEAIVDYRGKTPNKVDNGIPLITAKIVKDGRILAPTEFIAENDYDSWMVRGLPEIGDVVITTEAPLGEIAQLMDAYVALAQRIVTLRGKRGILNNDFLLCAMQSKYLQDQLESRASGSTVKGIKQSELRKVLLPIPPENEQIEIANHIKTLSNKIELNRQTNQTLEQIAQALFKSWFVDFDPVKAKIAAKQAGANAEQIEQVALCAISSKTPEQLSQLNPQILQQLKNTAALFPDALVDSELGEIPEGWIINELKVLASVISKGTTPTRGDINGATDVNRVPFLKVRDISDDGIISRKELDLIPDSIHIGVLKRSILKEKDILFSIAGTIGRVALVDEDLSYSNCNQAIAFIRLKNPDQLLDLCRLNLVGDRVQNEVISKVVQGVQANFSLAGLGEIKLLIPDERLLSQFNKTISSLRKHQRHLLVENSKLLELRDALLSKLLSGELNLSNLNEDTLFNRETGTDRDLSLL
jgi:type I restriction enzyme S subunit